MQRLNFHMSDKRTSLLALLLLLPAPGLGVYFGMILLPNTVLGKALFFLAKVWLFGLPLVWRHWVDRKPWTWSRPRHGGFVMGALLGLGISLFIVLMYITLGQRLLDTNRVHDMMVKIGLADPEIYIAGAVYWICVNSVLEEYVWRWFVVEKCQALLPARSAILLSAVGFTLHHIVALQVYCSGLVTGLCALGIFIGGAAWSWCYVRYKSIWPGYLSHALVDLAVFGVGYHIIFLR